ncbi:MAG: transposase [Acidobacteria bacterium]|nr:transposase [Acidobacteriota bacterium]
MARQLRIQYPGAFYHVFSRGNQKQPVFLSDDDRFFFLKCLREAHEKYRVIVHVYCLMPNHYHLILETPLGNLSNMMHFLNTAYTVYFNTKHKRCGHLFQGRYKSILIEAESYAQELSRYIHLNPVRSKIVEYPEQYPWSAYEYYRGAAGPEKWLETAFILSLFGEHPEEARKAYLEFVTKGIGLEIPASIRNSVRKGILGSDEFVARIKNEHLGEKLSKPDREKPQLRKLRKKPDLPLILSISEKVLGPRNKHLLPIAILISHKNSALKLREIGEFYSLSISSVSNACSRARVAIAGNATLTNAMEEIEQAIAKAEEKI